MWFVYKQLCALKRKDAILHGCDIDSAFPAAFYKATHNNGNKLIFDVFDWFSAALYNQKWYVLTAFKLMEKYTTKRADRLFFVNQNVLSKYHLRSLLQKLVYFQIFRFLIVAIF